MNILNGLKRGLLSAKSGEVLSNNTLETIKRLLEQPYRTQRTSLFAMKQGSILTTQNAFA